MRRWPKRQKGPIRVVPIGARYWPKAELNREQDLVPTTVDPTKRSGLDELAEAAKKGDTIWIEGRLDGLSKGELEWLGGELGAWEELPKLPTVDWHDFEGPLEAVGLQAPEEWRPPVEPIATGLLRALCYLYVQGSFGTARELFPAEDGLAARRARHLGGPLTAFPAVGFHPDPGTSDEEDPSYTMVRTGIAVVRGVVVSIRLPDVLCAESGDTQERTEHVVESLAVPSRFFAFWRTPTSADVALGIGVHQATTARSVAAKIRRRLEAHEKSARRLNALREGDAEPDDDTDPRKEAASANENLARLSETAHQLDQQLARVMRRFSKTPRGTPKRARELVPSEVRRRFQFALDDVRQLRDDCALTTESVQQALTLYDEDKRERLQHVAAILGAWVLVPALIASVFGVNFGVPGQENETGFLGFVVAIVLLGAAAYFAYRRAQANELRLAPWERNLFVAFVIVIVTALMAFLFMADRSTGPSP